MLLFSRLFQQYESLAPADLVQIAILAIGLFAFLRFLGRTGAGLSIGRGLGLVAVALFLGAQVVIASLDLIELGAVLDYLLTTALVGLVVIFQPELRRGLMMLGQTKLWRAWLPARHSVADPLADAAERCCATASAPWSPSSAKSAWQLMSKPASGSTPGCRHR